MTVAFTPAAAVLAALVFGVLHGLLPDEHTWPITFSYAVGAGSSRQGLKAGLIFALAFTAQRAVLSEISWWLLAPLVLFRRWEGALYLAIGALMAISGFISLRRGRYLHLHVMGGHHSQSDCVERADLPVGLIVSHGLVAGFAVGPFALFVFTVAAPAMGSAWLAFVPGLAYGLGTTLAQALIGGLFGALLHLRQWLSEEQAERLGQLAAGRSLLFGGLFFLLGGGVALAIPCLGQGWWGRAARWAIDGQIAVRLAMVPEFGVSHLVVMFLVGVALPVLAISWWQINRSGDAAEREKAS